mgnify:CR=1 FL=1
MKYLVIIFLIITSSTVCSAQVVEQTTDASSNYFEVNYPNYYYFYQYDKRFHLSLPLINMGIEYSHTNSNSTGIHTGLSSDYFRNLKTANSFGEISQRLVLYPSIGLHKTYFSTDKRLSVDVLGDLVGRLGGISTFGSSNEFESVYRVYDMLDVGVSVGAKLKILTKRKLTYSVGLKHSFFAYVFDKGVEFHDIPSSPRNVTTITLGIGLNFKK